MDMHKTYPNEVMLRNACNTCDLEPGWGSEVGLVLSYSNIPDPALPYGAMPYWLVYGIGLWRLMNRGFGG
jgi:hypothetical protein